MPHAGISTQPLDRDDARTVLADPRAGALVLFEGVVREHDHGREGVELLSYSAHPDAARIIGEVVAQIESEHGVTAYAVHRVGDLAVGDIALLAGCASAHRGEAFAACHALVDRVKEQVPVWKHQRFTDGTDEWVGLGDC